jgi:uncharacterized protein (TIGR02301 family)
MRGGPALALMLALAAPLAAQEASPQPDPPYQQRLERLAEVMGALHHLRPLCQPAEAQSWRRQIAQLIEAEQPSEARRDRIVAAFNRGFDGVSETHRTCTPATRTVADRYRDEAITLSREIAIRYAD